MKFIKLYSIIAFCVTMLSSCSNEQEQEEILSQDIKIKKSFTLYNEDEDVTRVSIGKIDTEFGKVYLGWDNGDLITVFAENHPNIKGDCFTLDQMENMRKASFNGETYDVSHYYFLYPYQESARYLGKIQTGTSNQPRIQYTIPDEQMAYDKNIDANVCVQVGQANANTSVQLKNICAYFYLDVDFNLCTEINFVSRNSNWALAGEVVSQLGSNTAEIVDFIDKKDRIKLEGTRAGGRYYIGFIPSANTGLPAIDVYFGPVAETTPKRTISKGQTFAAGSFNYLGHITSSFVNSGN